jgi:hypothetical protein
LTADFLGTLPGWITAAGVAAILGVVLRYRLGVGRLNLEGRKQDDANEKDIRDHYSEELGRVVQRQIECEKREAQLRGRVSQLENDILGLIRIISQASADKVLLLDEGVPEDIRQMAARIVGRTELG